MGRLVFLGVVHAQNGLFGGGAKLHLSAGSFKAAKGVGQNVSVTHFAPHPKVSYLTRSSNKSLVNRKI